MSRGPRCFALVAIVLAGCPDPSDRFAEFLDLTADQRPDPDAGEGESETTTGSGSDMQLECLPDMSGQYLLALETSLVADLPLQFVTTITMTLAPDCASATASFEFQPLGLEQGSLTEPRDFVGEPLVFEDVEFDAAGGFAIDFGEVMVTGLANPISSSEIVATLQIEGHVVHEAALCGAVTGDVSAPIVASLTGSNFAMIRIDDPSPAGLPTEFPWQCDQVPPL